MRGQILNHPSVELFETKAKASRLGYVGKSPLAESKRDSDSWFTPPLYVDSVRAVLGEITLDPFSSPVANKVIKARHIFTEEISAFDNAWNVEKKTKVFMNPPYSAGLCGRAANRFIEQYLENAFTQGIVLVNNATDTKWFSTLQKQCDAICFTDHRISFWNADHKSVSGNTRGQAFFYFGSSTKKFKKIFEAHGFIMVPAS